MENHAIDATSHWLMSTQVLDAAEDEPDEDNSWQDWTWDKPLGAKFSAGAEYLSFRTGRSWDRLWKDAQEPAVAPGPVGRLTPSEVLALRARGLGFLAPHAQIRELDCNDLLVDESTKPSEVFLTLEGYRRHRDATGTGRGRRRGRARRRREGLVPGHGH